MEKPDTQEQLLGEDEDSDLFKSSLNEEQTKLLRVRFDEEEEKEDIYQTEPTRRKRKETIVIRKDQWRDICINPGIEFRDQRNGGFRGNLIKTSKYTILNFLPKNLFLQFTKYANVYFLAMVVLQCIPAVSITQGQPTILFPLGFVTLVSMVKDIIEDYKRYSSDTAENNRKVLVLPQGTQEEEAESREGEEHFKDIKWKSVKVGQLCKIK